MEVLTWIVFLMISLSEAGVYLRFDLNLILIEQYLLEAFFCTQWIDRWYDHILIQEVLKCVKIIINKQCKYSWIVYNSNLFLVYKILQDNKKLTIHQDKQTHLHAIDNTTQLYYIYLTNMLLLSCIFNILHLLYHRPEVNLNIIIYF